MRAEGVESLSVVEQQRTRRGRYEPPPEDCDHLAPALTHESEVPTLFAVDAVLNLCPRDTADEMYRSEPR